MTFFIISQDSLLKEKITNQLPKFAQDFKIITCDFSTKQITKKINHIEETCLLLIFDDLLSSNKSINLQEKITTALILGNCISKNILTFTNIKEYSDNLTYLNKNLIYIQTLEDFIKYVKSNYSSIKNECVIKDARNKLFNLGIPFTPNCFSSYIQKNKSSLFKLFLDGQIDINSKDEDGTPLLNVAIRCENESLVKKLINLGVNINIPSEDRGYTPVMDAVWKGNKKITKLLIQKGADLNTINKEGQTNLILAVGADKIDICKLLVENGANPDIKDQMGMSAYGYATLFKKDKIREILKPYHKE